MRASKNHEFLRVALQHLNLEEPTIRTLECLPSIFCVCKRCYNECESYNVESIPLDIASSQSNRESNVTTSNLKFSRDPRGFFASSLPLDSADSLNIAPSLNIACPPLEEQSYVPERVIGFFQFAKAKEHILRLDQSRARVFSLTFLDLCEEFFRSLVLMQFPIFLGDLASENPEKASLNPQKAPLNPEKSKRDPCDQNRMQQELAKKAERIHLQQELKRKRRAARELKRRMLTPEE